MTASDHATKPLRNTLRERGHPYMSFDLRRNGDGRAPRRLRACGERQREQHQLHREHQHSARRMIWMVGDDEIGKAGGQPLATTFQEAMERMGPISSSASCYLSEPLRD
jgi:hypothetical protein